MNIIVIGLGQIGQEIAKELIQKEHQVTVIDVKKELIEEFTNKYEAKGIVGSGASRSILKLAKCEFADIVVSVAESDEINILSSFTAKCLGAKYTIAKVKSLEYKNDDEFLKEKFMIDLVINSEHSTADEITKIVGYPSNIKMERFLDSKINVAEVTLRDESPLIGTSIGDLIKKHKRRVNVGCIIRSGKIIFPNEETVFEEDDVVYFLANIVMLHKFLKTIRLIDKPVKSVMVVGCGNIGEKLVANLINMNIEVKIIEFDLKRCQDLSEKFADAIVVYGKEVTSDLLNEEGIKKYDCCISLTGSDESNLVTSMFAWSCKTRKIITKISSVSYTSMLHEVDIDTTVSPYSSVLSSVVRYIRSIKHCRNNSISALYRLANNEVDAIEFFIDKDYEQCNKVMSELKLKPHISMGLIVRGKDAIIPDEYTRIFKGDRVIIFAKANEGIGQFEDIFEE